MKLKIVSPEIPGPVTRRFPYLKKELHEMVVKNESFRQLCQDYKELISALNQSDAYVDDTRSELLGLKTTLEVEILEQVTRKGVLGRKLS